MSVHKKINLNRKAKLGRRIKTSALHELQDFDFQIIKNHCCRNLKRPLRKYRYLQELQHRYPKEQSILLSAYQIINMKKMKFGKIRFLSQK
jgi:hypothetical protein